MEVNVLGSRPACAVQDLFLSVELAAFLFNWLSQWSIGMSSSRKRMFFVSYALVLLGASLWCGLGAYIHFFEPLPTDQTPAWLAFLLLGAVTPLGFPIVCSYAFAEENGPSMRSQAMSTGLLAIGYVVVAVSAMDLSFGGRMPDKLWLTPWHAADGRSYGGESVGIKFDLMSSYPSFRGDSMFVLSSMFLIRNGLSIVVLRRAVRTHSNTGMTELYHAARRLTMYIGAMLVNSVALLYLLVLFDISLSKAFDMFHVGQGVIMALSFFEFRGILQMPISFKKAP